MNVKQKILVKHLSKYFLVRIKIPTLVEIPSWPGRRELRIGGDSSPSHWLKCASHRRRRQGAFLEGRPKHHAAARMQSPMDVQTGLASPRTMLP